MLMQHLVLHRQPAVSHRRSVVRTPRLPRCLCRNPFPGPPAELARTGASGRPRRLRAPPHVLPDASWSGIVVARCQQGSSLPSYRPASRTVPMNNFAGHVGGQLDQRRIPCHLGGRFRPVVQHHHIVHRGRGPVGPWPLIVDTVSVRLCRFRKRSGACGFVGVRADVADRGVAPASVVAVRPPEHGPVGGGLVRER